MRIYILLAFVLAFCFITSTTVAQNGKLISKRLVDISETAAWNYVSENNQLTSQFEYLNTLEFYLITYQSDSFLVKGIIVEPKESGIYPVVIFNRGGNRNFAPLNLTTIIMYTSRLAEQGYVIIGSNYREQDEFGGAEIEDVLCLTETAKEIEKADFNKIGMFGWSRGGMMTYLALRKSNKIKTAIVGNGPTDMFGVIASRPQIEIKVLAECIPNYYENKELELKNRSSIYWADKLNKTSSLLILAGTKDERVDFNQARSMSEKLNEMGYNSELKEFDTDHFFSDKKAELNDAVINWFNKELK